MSNHRTGRSRRTFAGVAALTTLLGAGAAAVAPGVAQASSHREAPLTAGDPKTDNTDVYAFVSPDKSGSVNLIANWIPFEEPNGGPNFYPFADGAHYNINIDNNGDAKPDITYRWTFSSSYQNTSTFLYNTGPVNSLSDPNLNFRQTYTLERITYNASGVEQPTTMASNVPVAPSNVGPASMPHYAELRNQAIRTVGTGTSAGAKTFAGQADDPFFLDLRIFDLLYGANLKEVGHDTLSGYNVNTIALQVPKADLAVNNDAGRNPVVGVWSTTERQSLRTLAPTDTKAAGGSTTPGSGLQTDSGSFAQVSRLGNPLVNEVVIPLKDKDNFNNSTPVNDANNFLPYVQDPEVPRLVQSIYKVPAPATPRNDLVEVFLKGICKACGPVGSALGADLNSQMINKDQPSGGFQPAEELRLNMGVAPAANPNRLGALGKDYAGFPNGRRLTDDVVDIELKALEGALPPYNADTSAFTDGVNTNDKAFGASFPYVALPHDNSVNVPGVSTNTSMFAASRLAGTNRFGTAAALARSAFGTSSSVVLANGEAGHYPDALTGNYLAGNLSAPILLTSSGMTPKETLDALKSLQTTNIVIVGGTAAVSDAQAAALTKAGYTVSRVAGKDRYQTASAVAAKPGVGFVSRQTALLASGQAFPDALVAGPASNSAHYPTEITTSSSLSPDTRASLQALGIKNVIIVGGTAAVSTNVENQLKALGITVTRVGGSTRSETASMMAAYDVANLGFDVEHVNIARGDDDADALAGGPHAGRDKAAILLAQDPNTLGASTEAYLKATFPKAADVFGGTAAVKDATVAKATADVRSASSSVS